MKQEIPIDPHQVLLVSVDFETLGLDANTVIIGLGAVIETPLNENKSIKRRRRKVSHFPISATCQPGRLMDAQTITFWRTMTDNSLRIGFEQAMVGQAVHVKAAIADLFKRVEDAIAYSFPNADPDSSDFPGVYWVFKPAMYDGAILRSICVHLGPEWVEKLDKLSGGVYRRRCLDMNTLKFALEMMGIEPPEVPKPGHVHHPLADALAQMEGVKLYLAALRMGYNAMSGQFGDAGELRHRAHGRYVTRQLVPVNLADMAPDAEDLDEPQGAVSLDMAELQVNAPEVDEEATGELVDEDDSETAQAVAQGVESATGHLADQLTHSLRIEIDQAPPGVDARSAIGQAGRLDAIADDPDAEPGESTFDPNMIVEEGRKVIEAKPPGGFPTEVDPDGDAPQIKLTGFGAMVDAAMKARAAQVDDDPASAEKLAALRDLEATCNTHLNRLQLESFDPREQTLSERAQGEIVPLLRKLLGITQTREGLSGIMEPRGVRIRSDGEAQRRAQLAAGQDR